MTLPLPLVDPDDPKFKGKTWDVIEAHLQARDAEQLSTMGYDLEEPEENGPSAAYPCRPLLASFPWEERIDGFAKPASCNLQNWKHTCLTYTVGKGCATLAFAKGAANNTLDPAMLDALQDAILDLQTRSDVRVVVIRSEGKVFSSGFDPKYILSESSKTEEEIRAIQTQFAKILYFLSTLPQFVLALTQGSAMGASIGLLCACDMVYSVKGAYFAMNEGKLGVVPSVSLPYIIRRIPYMANTRNLVLAAQSFSAPQAKSAGLIQEVYEDDAALQAACVAFVGKMSACAPGAVAATKEVIMNTVGQAPSSFMLNYVSTVTAAQRRSAEAKAGIEAIQSKKRPAWAETPLTA
jgi:enoyl-CoA hydratase/carnithine racemase